MKTGKRLFTLCLAALLALGCASTASAAETSDATVDVSRTGSLTIYKYDITSSEKDGVWDSSYVSTGVYDPAVNEALGNAVRNGDTDNSCDLGNGDVSYGYAIRGVQFSYLKVAEVVQYQETAGDAEQYGHVEILYGIDKVRGADFLAALGLTDGAGRYLPADSSDKLDGARYYYTSDTLKTSLSEALTNNATKVKNALERYLAANGATDMPLTDAYGKTDVTDLPLGLYLVAETLVPEMVTNTVNPFLVALPMTSIDGGNASDGGTRWIYDVTLYPKNETGIPSLEKTLRENIADTGKNDGSADDMTDGYAHTGTASAGDVIDYQIISRLPSITSESTYLSEYTFIDTLSKGLAYNRSDVRMEFFRDEACTDRIAVWTDADGKFTVSYTATTDGSSVMTVEMTDKGLAEINSADSVYTEETMCNSGYSDCTVRITYQATVNSDADTVYGDNGNPNEVVLVWKRTSEDFYDTLVDDAHLYTYGIDLTKLFSDGQGDFSKVEFIVRNDTDGYFVVAELNETEGIYYVTGHTENEAEATHFIPVDSGDGSGKVIIKGMEDDTYTVTEVRTANGYTLLKEDIEIVISHKETEELCGIYQSDVLGLIQNDPRYAEILGGDTELVNILQTHMEHHLLTASATVDGNDVNMLTDNGSLNAEAPLTVMNTKGFDLPQTGDRGVWMYGTAGIVLMAAALLLLSTLTKKKKHAK